MKGVLSYTEIIILEFDIDVEKSTNYVTWYEELLEVTLLWFGQKFLFFVTEFMMLLLTELNCARYVDEILYYCEMLW